MNWNQLTFPRAAKPLALALILSLGASTSCGMIETARARLTGQLSASQSISPAPASRPRAQVNAIRENVQLYLNETERADDPAGFVLLDRHGLAFLAVRDQRGNWVRRLRHPSRLELDDLGGNVPF